jgi:hypothetical protein
LAPQNYPGSKLSRAGDDSRDSGIVGCTALPEPCAVVDDHDSSCWDVGVGCCDLEVLGGVRAAEDDIALRATQLQSLLAILPVELNFAVSAVDEDRVRAGCPPKCDAPEDVRSAKGEHASPQP